MSVVDVAQADQHHCSPEIDQREAITGRLHAECVDIRSPFAVPLHDRLGSKVRVRRSPCYPRVVLLHTVQSLAHRVAHVMMKLLTHNMLTSHVKAVKNGYPLRILVSFSECIHFLVSIQRCQSCVSSCRRGRWR